MPDGGFSTTWTSPRPSKAGRPHRDRSRNKAARKARRARR